MNQYFEEDIPASVMCTPADNHGMIFANDKEWEYMFEQPELNIWRSSFDYWLVRQAVKAGSELQDGAMALSCETQKAHLLLLRQQVRAADLQVALQSDSDPYTYESQKPE